MTVQTLNCLLERFPKVGICELPTPMRPLKNLSRHLGGPMIWEKREDLTGQGMGGNKLRKLDRVLYTAIAEGADVLVSGGVIQSNSQRQVAAAAAMLGLDCHLAVYHGRVEPPTAQYESSGNALLNRLYGATLHDVKWAGDRNGLVESLAAQLSKNGKQPFVVPYGVSDGMGAVGYASAVAEFALQSKAAVFTPSAIIHCSGSCASQAGLVVGAQIALPECDIVGIDIDAEPKRVRADVVQFVHAGAEILGLPIVEDVEDKVEVVAGHAGPAYGVPHDATIEALKLAGRLEGMTLDPVYSAKGLAGLIALVIANRWSKSDHIVFVNTGGVPALFAYAEVLSV